MALEFRASLNRSPWKYARTSVPSRHVARGLPSITLFLRSRHAEESSSISTTLWSRVSAHLRQIGSLARIGVSYRWITTPLPPVDTPAAHPTPTSRARVTSNPEPTRDLPDRWDGQTWTDRVQPSAPAKGIGGIVGHVEAAALSGAQPRPAADGMSYVVLQTAYHHHGGVG